MKRCIHCKSKARFNLVKIEGELISRLDQPGEKVCAGCAKFFYNYPPFAVTEHATILGPGGVYEGTNIKSSKYRDKKMRQAYLDWKEENRAEEFTD